MSQQYDKYSIWTEEVPLNPDGTMTNGYADRLDILLHKAGLEVDRSVNLIESGGHVRFTLMPVPEPSETKLRHTREEDAEAFGQIVTMASCAFEGPNEFPTEELREILEIACEHQ